MVAQLHKLLKLHNKLEVLLRRILLRILKVEQKLNSQETTVELLFQLVLTMPLEQLEKQN